MYMLRNELLIRCEVSREGVRVVETVQVFS